MVNKTLLGGIIGFILGGLLVSAVAVTLENDQPKDRGSQNSMHEHNETVTSKLKSLKGDAFDEAFIKEMINHHKGAIDMANLTEANAKHEEIKTLANTVITTQSQEIEKMQAWQSDWGYNASQHHHKHR